MYTEYYITPMSCKEFVEKRFPNDNTDLLKLCPYNFGLSVIPFPCKHECSTCWNQPAKYHGKWIMKVKVSYGFYDY